MTEVEVGQAVVSHLSECGYEVYQEVPLTYFDSIGVKRADIVYVHQSIPKIVGVVECKSTLSTQLLDQAYKWTSYAHHIWVAAPCSRRGISPVVMMILEHLGIGLMVVDDDGIHIRINPKINRKAYATAIRKSLNDKQKTENVAGMKYGHWTPFKETCFNLLRFVEKHPGCSLKESIGSIDTHYRRDATALTVIAARLRDGVVNKVLGNAGKKLIDIRYTGPRCSIQLYAEAANERL